MQALAQLLKKPKKMSLSQFAVVLPQLCTTGQLWFIHCQSKQDGAVKIYAQNCLQAPAE
jgi:hypothetical protein